MLPASKAQQKAVAKYMKENYEEIKIRVPKGKKSVIKAAADEAGVSLNKYVNDAIDEKMKEGSI